MHTSGKQVLKDQLRPSHPPFITVVIWWVSPRFGSIAGGTVLDIHGSEFVTDAFTSSNIVWLEGEGTRVICDVIRLAALLCVYTKLRSECGELSKTNL